MFWMDLPIDKDVSVEKVVAVSREIEATARIIPRDYAKQYLIGCGATWWWRNCP